MKKILYITFVAALVALTSCSEKIDTVGGDYLDTINITASVGEQIVGRSNPVTENQTAFNSGDVIAVAITELGEEQDEVHYTYNGSTWSASSYLFWTSDNLDFQAYYPVGEGVSNTSFTLPTDQSSLVKIAAADYMTACGALTNVGGSSTATIEFERQCARIIVNIDSFGSQWSSSAKITSLTINSGADEIGGSSAVAVTPYISGNIYTALVIPTTSSSEVFLNITVDDGGITKNLTYTGLPACEASYSYTYNLSVGYDKVEILGNILVDYWTTATTTLTSNAPTKSAPEVGYFLYDDFDYSKTLVESKTAIGIVSNVEDGYATAVSLDEVASVVWSINADSNECDNTTNAVANMKVIYDYAIANEQNRFVDFPAMDWVDAKNSYIGDYSGRYEIWALPTVQDLYDIYTNITIILESIDDLNNEDDDILTFKETYWSSLTLDDDMNNVSNAWAKGVMSSGGVVSTSKTTNSYSAVAVISFTY